MRFSRDEILLYKILRDVLFYKKADVQFLRKVSRQKVSQISHARFLENIMTSSPKNKAKQEFQTPNEMKNEKLKKLR